MSYAVTVTIQKGASRLCINTKEAGSSEMSVPVTQTTGCHIPIDRNLNNIN
jgi:hypothetical protein